MFTLKCVSLIFFVNPVNINIKMHIVQNTMNVLCLRFYNYVKFYSKAERKKKSN